MEYQFPSNVRSVRPSLIREFSNNVKQYKDAIDLTLGQPDFPTPERVKQAGIKAILENHTGYTKNDGIAELRQAAAKYLKEQSHVTYDPEWRSWLPVVQQKQLMWHFVLSFPVVMMC